MAAYDDASFRLMFPAYADPVKYPTATIAAYWNMATLFISATDCPYNTLSGETLQAALNMLCAHLLFLAGQAATATGASSAATTKMGGFTTSASVGEVSVAKLAPPATNAWQWWLAGSPGGQMLWALLSLLAVGGFTVGGLPEREGFRKAGGVFW